MRMWEIREGEYSPKHRGEYYGHKGPEYGKEREYRGKDELKEAYECGYEDGYEEAMKEVEGRHAYSRMRRY